MPWPIESVIVASLACSVGSCAAPSHAVRAESLPRFEFSRLAMGVEARIVLYAGSQEDADVAAEAAFATIQRLDEVLSDWTETSEASQLAAHAGEGPIEVGPELFGVLEQSLEIARFTHGAFDPTVGPLTALWRRARALGRMPDPAEIARAHALVSIDAVILDPSSRTVELTHRGMQLDFGAIGKGFACQRAIETLAREGISSALVQMGGDLVCSGAPPGTEGWSVDLPGSEADPDRTLRADPHMQDGETRPTDRVNTARMLLVHQALAISGDAAQWIEIDGVRRSHVIDPRSGLGLTTHSTSIVVAPDGAVSDALATACGVLGAKEGVASIAQRPDCEARIEEHVGGALLRRETPGFARLPRIFPELR